MVTITRKVSKISLFFFFLNFNYILLRLILFPILYNSFNKLNLLNLIIGILIIILIILILPSKLFNKSFLKEYNNSKIKHFINYLLIIRTAILIFIASFISYNIFNIGGNILSSLIPLLLVIIIISFNQIKAIIEISLPFSVVALICYLFYGFGITDISFVSLNNLSISINYFIPLILFILLVDNLTILLGSDETINFTKKDFIIGILFSFIFFIFELLMLIFQAGDKLFINDLFVGFRPMRIQRISKYIGSYSFIYIIIISIGIIFKGSYFMAIVNNENKIFNNIILTIIVFLLYFMITKIPYNIIYFISIIIFLSIVLVIWLFIRSFNDGKTTK